MPLQSGLSSRGANKSVVIGDYNGDGRDDILWRHTDGTTSNWLGTASGGWTPNDANTAAPVPNVWIVQPEDYLV